MLLYVLLNDYYIICQIRIPVDAYYSFKYSYFKELLHYYACYGLLLIEDAQTHQYLLLNYKDELYFLFHFKRVKDNYEDCNYSNI